MTHRLKRLARVHRLLEAAMMGISANEQLDELMLEFINECTHADQELQELLERFYKDKDVKVSDRNVVVDLTDTLLNLFDQLKQLTEPDGTPSLDFIRNVYTLEEPFQALEQQVPQYLSELRDTDSKRVIRQDTALIADVINKLSTALQESKWIFEGQAPTPTEQTAHRRSRLKRAYHDIQEREEAILIINDKVYEGYSHSELLREYLMDHYDISQYQQETPEDEDLEEDEDGDDDDPFSMYDEYGGYEDDGLPFSGIRRPSESEIESYLNDLNLSYGFASLARDPDNDLRYGVFLDTNSLHNLTVDEAIVILRKRYPNYPIFDDNSTRFATNNWSEYELLDSPNPEDWERYESYYGDDELA